MSDNATPLEGMIDNGQPLPTHSLCFFRAPAHEHIKTSSPVSGFIIPLMCYSLKRICVDRGMRWETEWQHLRPGCRTRPLRSPCDVRMLSEPFYYAVRNFASFYGHPNITELQLPGYSRAQLPRRHVSVQISPKSDPIAGPTTPLRLDSDQTQAGSFIRAS